MSINQSDLCNLYVNSLNSIVLPNTVENCNNKGWQALSNTMSQRAICLCPNVLTFLDEFNNYLDCLENTDSLNLDCFENTSTLELTAFDICVFNQTDCFVNEENSSSSSLSLYANCYNNIETSNVCNNPEFIQDIQVTDNDNTTDNTNNDNNTDEERNIELDDTTDNTNDNTTDEERNIELDNDTTDNNDEDNTNNDTTENNDEDRNIELDNNSNSTEGQNNETNNSYKLTSVSTILVILIMLYIM